MYRQVLFFRMLMLAVAAVTLFIVLHVAAQAFRETAGALTQALS